MPEWHDAAPDVEPWRTMTGMSHFDLDARDARELWEGMYSASERVWSGNPNVVLVDAVRELSAGTALDLGCGEGADVIWLARQGWQVTGVDVSDTALARARVHAEQSGVTTSVSFEQHDLGATFPTGTFDLVAASFLHSYAHLDRDGVLRRAADAVAPGGALVVIGHVQRPPWADPLPVEVVLPTPDDVHAALDLDPGRWSVRRAELVEREVDGPGTRRATIADGLLVAVRAR
ncbi:MAG: class I SAM-dependent methyltransferase [Janthinobacterium lividum]